LVIKSEEMFQKNKAAMKMKYDLIAYTTNEKQQKRQQKQLEII
jgi:hypothetical protein